MGARCRRSERKLHRIARIARNLKARRRSGHTSPLLPADKPATLFTASPCELSALPSIANAVDSHAATVVKAENPNAQTVSPRGGATDVRVVVQPQIVSRRVYLALDGIPEESVQKTCHAEPKRALPASTSCGLQPKAQALAKPTLAKHPFVTAEPAKRPQQLPPVDRQPIGASHRCPPPLPQQQAAVVTTVPGMLPQQPQVQTGEGAWPAPRWPPPPLPARSPVHPTVALHHPPPLPRPLAPHWSSWTPPWQHQGWPHQGWWAAVPFQNLTWQARPAQPVVGSPLPHSAHWPHYSPCGSSPPAGPSKTLFILDGLNILKHIQDGQPLTILRWEQLLSAVTYFTAKANDVLVFLPRLPDSHFHQLQQLRQVGGHQCIVTTPAGMDDDAFMIQHALDLQQQQPNRVTVHIVSNDLFRDSKRVSQMWVRENTMKFAFAAGRFVAVHSTLT
eukprot:TRINITY_DN41953_c0_g1_i2.p1 TRINITY_DN41953_c0_g1~~TRINITY_DN41953_c0_g1_i2.p1  ORF type:complete len:448 (-),score=14.70 TRINITY_DN41953_c0_g1_i2:47-1390(-)